MYGGCALSMEQSEVPPKAAADSRVGRAGGLALRALLAADGRRVGGQRPALRLRAAPRTRSPLQCRVLPLMRGAGAFTARLAPSCALALRSSGGAGFHVRLTPQCRGAVGCGSVCGVAAAGTANAVGGALP